MAINEELTKRVRAALSHLKDVEEKKMFSGITFMVNGKMCISVGDDRLMCRFDPSLHKEVLKHKDCRTVEMKGRKYKGYVYVSEEAIPSKDELDYWIRLALSFNRKAKKIRKKIT
ncbi:MAG: TfoX/Sxy family protein [Chitinophagaceae bacterium]